MAQIYLTGNVPSALGLDYTRNVPLSGGGGAQDYINSVVADIYMSTNAYTNTYNVTVTLKNSSGGVLASSNRADIKFNADNYGGANWQFGFNRNDLVVAEYVIGGGDTSDTHVLKVIKGTQTAGAATDPTLEQDSLITGTSGDKRQEPLFRLTLAGTTLSGTITRIADYIGSYYA